jgi:type IV pilus assembly protein PilM
MAHQPIGVWGIDLGQCGLKAIRLQEIDGQLVATAFDYVEHPKILSQPDADPDQLTREALDKFLSRNNLRGDIVCISVPGQSGLARFVKLPPVEEKKIADIVRFEAKQQIPFNLDEVVWDYQKIGSGVVTDGFAMETEIGLFAMKRDMVGRYLQHFKDVNIDVHVVQMAPLALCNYISFDLLGKDAQPGEEGGGDKKCIVALDIGTDSSNLVITDGERIIWQRPIPLGGNHFTRALTKDLKLTFAKAEHLKRNATKSPDLKKILAALRPVLNDFVGEVQRSLGYFTNTHRDAHIEYMIGLGNAFRLPGLQKFLSEKLQLEVKKLTKMERINGDQVVTQQVFVENILTFGVAYGLALQGLKRARLLTNLLPNEIRVERLIKAKKPFAAAAAAALLFASLGLALSYGLEKRTWGDKRVENAVNKASEAAKKAQSAKSAFDNAKKKAKEEEDNVKTIVAGQFERDNWPELFKFINAAIPQPDIHKKREYKVLAEDGDVAETITIDDIPVDLPEVQAKYVPKADKAYQEYLNQHVVVEGGDSGKEANPSVQEDLVQFNIESVKAFFCDNLSTYWDLVKKSDRVKKNREEWVRPKDHFGKAPQGAGWIIEIHGWTYHNDKENFIKNTLLENLARLGIREKKADTDASGGAAPAAATPAPAPNVPVALPARSGTTGSEQKEPEPLGPVINSISHVVLYKTAQSSSGAPFEILNESTHEEVKELALGIVTGTSGPAGMLGMGGPGGAPTPGGGMPSGPDTSSGSPPGGMPGAGGLSGGAPGGQASTAPNRKDWTPLGVEPSTKGSSMGSLGPSGPMDMMRRRGSNVAMPGGPPGDDAARRRMEMMRRGGMVPPGMQPPGGQQQPAENDHGLKRTEFVILFIWKEPTDSDRLRNLTSDQGGASASSAPAADAQPHFRRPKGGRGRQKGR